MKYEVLMNVRSVIVDGVVYPVVKEEDKRVVELPDNYKNKLKILKPIVEEKPKQKPKEEIMVAGPNRRKENK